MAHTIKKLTHSAVRCDDFSETPKNYSKDNYYLQQLQDKINAEWGYRPNRVDIEYESNWELHDKGVYLKSIYKPIEVVLQTIKSETGEAVSNEYKRVVFRNILENRFRIGSKFKFGTFKGKNVDEIPERQKNVWLSTNTDNVKMTSSMVIERCNGTLGSLYTDSQGVSHRHYEPVILKKSLTGVNFSYSETAISPQAQLEITAQYNDYTRDYFINQRFVVGYNSVYRIKAINKFDGESTFWDVPRSEIDGDITVDEVGLIKIYLEMTEKDSKDDFKNRIAENGSDTIIQDEDDAEEQGTDSFAIKFTAPNVIPTFITEVPVVFSPIVIKSDGTQDTNKSVKLTYELENLPETVDIGQYVLIAEEGKDITITRQRKYSRGNLVLNWSIYEGEELIKENAFSFSVRLQG